MSDSTQSAVSRAHPCGARKPTGKTPRGRQVEPAALAEVQALLGNASRCRDALIEHLHLVQDE